MKKPESKRHLTFRADNLALPEILTDSENPDMEDCDLDDEELDEIQYETLAIPEYHLKKAK